ncbi:MAG TPA: hypothetical protein ENG65_02725 [Candidatus Bathyarchaeota archaeon]|nr:hypothetical protein [Candidatus Bathyarchaeota archaeon]
MLSVMESKRYREFLRRQAAIRPLKKNFVGGKIILGVLSEEDRSEHEGSSDILESLLLRGGIKGDATTDSEAVLLLQYRLEMLERENSQMRKSIRLMKILIAFMALTILAVSILMIKLLL